MQLILLIRSILTLKLQLLNMMKNKFRIDIFECNIRYRDTLYALIRSLL